jgi:ABC-2 type transport system permease protein
MTLTLVHTRVMTLELLRHPAYVVPTLAFPTAFFLFFATSDVDPNVRMATFAGFAAIGVAFFQFGVGIAAERESPWERYLRTLPVSALARLGARLLSAAVFATGAAALLIVVATVSTNVALPVGRWFELGGVLLAGTVPFALLGIALGYWVPARGALPIANLLYLGLSYVGGLWFSPEHLSHGLATVSRFLPTRAFADALAEPARGGSVPWGSWAALAGFSLLFAVFALAGYRRDEGRRFR